MWYQCHFELEEAAQMRLFGAGPRSGSTYRGWLARRNREASMGLPPAFFNYGADGKPLNEIGNVRMASGVRVGWYPRGMVLSAVGREAVTVARAAGPAIQAELIKSSGHLVRANVRNGVNTVALKPKGVEIRYFCPSLVISPDKVGKWLEFLDAGAAQGVPALMIPEARAWAERLISDHLKRQLHMHAVNEEGVWEEDEDEMQASRCVGPEWKGESPFSVRITSAGRRFVIDKVNAVSRMIGADHGQVRKKTMVGFSNVELSINAHLQGVWAVGRYQSHGYGVLFPAARQIPERKAA